MFLRSKLFWLTHARRVAIVFALLSVGEALLSSSSTQIAGSPQAQSFRFFDLPMLRMAHAGDDSRRRVLNERLNRVRQKREAQRRRWAEQKQQAQQRRQAQRRQRAEQKQQEQQRRQAQRRQRAEQKQQAQQQRQAQLRKRAEQKQQAQQKRQAQRRQRAEQKQQAQQKRQAQKRRQADGKQPTPKKRAEQKQQARQPQKAQRQHVPEEKRLTQQVNQPSNREPETSKEVELELGAPEVIASQETEIKPSTTLEVAPVADGRSVHEDIDNIPEKPPGFDVMDPPFTLVEMVKQISQPKNPAPKVSPAVQKPYRPAASALGAPPSLVAPNPVVPSSITPTPVVAAPPSKSQKRPTYRNKGRPVPLSEIVVPMLPQITPRELLATNVAPATLKRALSMGFKVAASQSYSGLGMSITRLIVPPSMSEVEARRVMQTQLHVGRVGYNHTYRLYRTATGNNGRQLSTTYENRDACVAGDCNGQSRIGWTKKLDRCVEGIKIGVIDTGVDTEHPAFSGRRIEFATTVIGKKPLSPNSHGTGILSLLAGSPKSGVNGLIPSASFVISDVFFKDRDGFPITDTISLLNALELMEKRGVAVVNLSIAGPKDSLIEDAIAKLSKTGMIFIAAAGNGGPAARPSYPAAYKQVIAVTAVASNLRAFRYANHGKYIDIAAPGVRIWTAQPNRKYGFQTGTSFAVPFVTAAVAAIYRSLPLKTRRGALKRLSVLDLGAPGRDQIYGRGMMVAPQGCSPAMDSWSTSVKQEPIGGGVGSQFASH